MKHLHKTLIGWPDARALAGCNDFLDLLVPRRGQLRHSVLDHHAGRIGRRRRLQQHSLRLYRRQPLAPQLGRLLVGHGPHRRHISPQLLLPHGTIQPNDASFPTYWKRFYEGINRANDVINNIASCPTMSDALKRQRIAECKFLRAFHYYRLNCLWRGVPVYLENLSLPGSTPCPFFGGAGVGIIIDDLDDCIACEELPGKYKSSDSGYGRVTKGAAYTLRGRVYQCRRSGRRPRRISSRSENWATTSTGRLCRPVQTGQREVRRDDLQRPDGGGAGLRQRLQLYLRQHGHQGQRHLVVLHERPLRRLLRGGPTAGLSTGTT